MSDFRPMNLQPGEVVQHHRSGLILLVLKLSSERNDYRCVVLCGNSAYSPGDIGTWTCLLPNWEVLA